MHPVGPRPPGVYWIRRVIFIVVLIAVLVGVIFVVAGRSTGGTPSGAGQKVAVTGSAAPTLTGVLASRPTAAASAGLPTSVTGLSAAASSSTTAASTSAAVTPSSSAASSTTAGSVPRTTTARAAAPVTKSPAVPATQTATTAKPTPTSGKATPTTAKPAVTSAKPAVTSAKPAVTSAKPATTAAATSVAVSTKVPTTPATTSAKPAPTSAKAIPPSAKPTPAAPSTDAQGRLLCSDAVLQLTATTGAPSFVVGDRPILGVSVKNTGSVPCTRDLSGPLQVFTVYTAAGARVWSTADCFPGEGTDVRTLPAQAAVQYNVKWSGTTSAPGCAGARVQVPAGRYQVRVTVGSLRSTPADFVIG